MRIFTRKKRKETKAAASFIYQTTLKMTVPVLILMSFCFITIFLQGLIRFTNRSVDIVTKSTSESVGWMIKSYKNIAEDLGTFSVLSNDDIPLEKKDSILEKKCQEYGLERGKIINRNGYSDMDDKFRGNRLYFNQALQGETVISDPLVAMTDSQVSIIIASPLWENGDYGGNIKGVVWFSVNPSVFNSFIENISLTKNYKAYIINKHGTVVASTNSEDVINMYNCVKEAEKENKFSNRAKIEKRILEGETGVFKTKFKNKKIVMASYPIENANGWHLVVETPYVGFLKDFQLATIVIILLTVLCLLLSRIHSKKMAEFISKPASYLSERLKYAADGDFTSDIHCDSFISEMRQIAEATQRLVVRMNMTLNGNEYYLNKLTLTDIIDVPVLQEMIKEYRLIAHANIVVRDMKDNIIAGEENYIASAEVFKEKLNFSGQNYGVMEISRLPECTLSDQDLKQRVYGITRNMVLFGSTTIKKSMSYKTWKENELIGLRHIFGMNEKLERNMGEWVGELESMDKSGLNKHIKADLLLMVANARDLLNEFTETTELTRMAISGEGDKDCEYSLSELADSLKRSIKLSYMNGEIDTIINISCKENVKVFGDNHKLEGIIDHLLGSLCREKVEEITMDISHERRIYSDDVIISISCPDEGFISNEINKFQLFDSKSLNLDAKDLNFFEQSIITYLRRIKGMGGEHSFMISDGRVKITLKIPQIIVNDASEDD